MRDLWLEYLQIVQHPYLDRFKNGSDVELMYEWAVYGMPPLYYGRDPRYYGRAINTAAAIERLGDLIVSRSDMSADWLKVLEDCETPESINLIEKIFIHFPHHPHDSPPESGGYNALPTEKQRKLLRKLGVIDYTGTRAEASILIDKIKTW